MVPFQASLSFQNSEEQVLDGSEVCRVAVFEFPERFGSLYCQERSPNSFGGTQYLLHNLPINKIITFC
jgi:hypothetical protein